MTADETQPVQEEQEKKQTGQFAKWVVQVLYSPMKAFEEVVKKPSIKGPILILLIILPIVLAGQYASGSKLFLENPTPEEDLWTEKPTSAPSFYWNSSGNIIFDGNDYKVGNYSISASATNSSTIWMRLTDIGSFNCSEKEYSRLSFRIKWVNEANATPTATLQLFSLGNENRQFDLNIENLIADSTDLWANVSVNLDTEAWTPKNSPNWVNITGIEVFLEWASPANVTVKLDDLFFGKYVQFSSTSVFNLYIAYQLVLNAMGFLLQWVILSAVALLALRSFSSWKGAWKDLLSVVGHVYSVSIIKFGVFVLFYLLLLPPFYFPLYATPEIIANYQSSWIMPEYALNVIFLGWMVVLCAVAMKKVQEELSWSKAFLIGFGAIVMSLLFSSFLLNAFV